MDLRNLLGKLDQLSEGTMASAEKKSRGPKFTGKWKGTDPASAAKDKYVGGMEESIFKELEETLQKQPARDLKREFAEYKKSNAGISKDQETQFHAKLDKLVHDTFGKRKDEVAESSDIERKIHRTQALIQDYYKRARETRNDIRRDHFIDMARQLEFELDGMINDANQAEQDSYDVAQHDAEPSATWNRGGLNEYAISDNGDGDNDDVLFQYAKMWYNGDIKVQQMIEQVLDKHGLEIGEIESEEGGAFIVQAGDEDGNSYNGWSSSELQDLKEGFSDLELAVMEGGHELISEVAPPAPAGQAPATQPPAQQQKPQLGADVTQQDKENADQAQQAQAQADAAKQAATQDQQQQSALQKGVNMLKQAGAAISNPGQLTQAFDKVGDKEKLNPADKNNVASAGTVLAPIMSNPSLAGKFKDLVNQASTVEKQQQQKQQQQAQQTQQPVAPAQPNAPTGAPK